MLPNMHPLFKAVQQAAQQFMKKHHSPLHELMHKFKLKPELLEKILAVRQNPKWEPGVAIRIAGDKEKAQEEDNADCTSIRFYTDGSGIEGKIRAVAMLYCDGVLVKKRRIRLGSEKHHTVFKGEGIGLILGLELIRKEERAEGMVSIGINNVDMLCNKHKRLDLLVRWTLGHTEIVGNEKADEEAKKAAREGSST